MSDDFKEKLRSLNFGKVPGGAREKVDTFRPMQDPSWEKGVVRDHRGVPYQHIETGSPITVKQWANDRPTYEEAVRKLRQSPGGEG